LKNQADQGYQENVSSDVSSAAIETKLAVSRARGREKKGKRGRVVRVNEVGAMSEFNQVKSSSEGESARTRESERNRAKIATWISIVNVILVAAESTTSIRSTCPIGLHRRSV